jgi:hypothetical protein
MLLNQEYRGVIFMFNEYKIIQVTEGGLGTVFLGASGIPVKKMEIALNQEVADGWQVVFQVIEKRDFYFFGNENRLLSL